MTNNKALRNKLLVPLNIVYAIIIRKRQTIRLRLRAKSL